LQYLYLGLTTLSSDKLWLSGCNCQMQNSELPVLPVNSSCYVDDSTAYVKHATAYDLTSVSN